MEENNKKNLTNSGIDRQNMLNNPIALTAIQNEIHIPGTLFENEYKFTKRQIADFYEVDERTIDRYVEQFNEELSKNGYEILKGKRLKDFIALYNSKVDDIDVVDLPKTVPALSVFNFKSFLNLGMLLTDSEKAKVIRALILDIVIDVINKKTGGNTKYINQRDEDFIDSAFSEENYRKEFTKALNNYVVPGKSKFSIYTNKIYVSIFKENAAEYRKILNLQKKDKTRDTFYSEILDVIASYEIGLASELQIAFNKKGSLLEYTEVDEIFENFENQALWIPTIKKARTKMASRDLAFRDALHEKLVRYLEPLEKEEFERFLGERSKDLSERLNEAQDVLKRLKERE